jgi:hypothetical protein
MLALKPHPFDGDAAMPRTRKYSEPEAASDSPYKPPEERKSGPFDDYEVRGALETLSKAIKIRKNPTLMRAVRTEARKQLAAAESTKKALSGE